MSSFNKISFWQVNLRNVRKAIFFFSKQPWEKKKQNNSHWDSTHLLPLLILKTIMWSDLVKFYHWFILQVKIKNGGLEMKGNLPGLQSKGVAKLKSELKSLNSGSPLLLLIAYFLSWVKHRYGDKAIPRLQNSKYTHLICNTGQTNIIFLVMSIL